MRAPPDHSFPVRGLFIIILFSYFFVEPQPINYEHGYTILYTEIRKMVAVTLIIIITLYVCVCVCVWPQLVRTEIRGTEDKYNSRGTSDRDDQSSCGHETRCPQHPTSIILQQLDTHCRGFHPHPCGNDLSTTVRFRPRSSSIS